MRWASRTCTAKLGVAFSPRASAAASEMGRGRGRACSVEAPKTIASKRKTFVIIAEKMKE